MHGAVEGGADLAAVGVNVEARGEEEGDDGFLPEADGEVERGAVEGVGVGRVGTGGEEEARSLCEAVLGCPVEGGFVGPGSVGVVGFG